MKPFFALPIILVLLTSCVPPSEIRRAELKTAAPQSTPHTPLGKIQALGEKGAIPDEATPIKVGLLLPLTGDSAAVGNAMLDAATMAVYDQYMSVPASQIRSQIVLIPKDTGSTPSETTRAAEQVIKQGATFIIGPLFAQSVTAMKPVLDANHITAITFSNNKAVASPNTFTFGFLPEQQISRMAEFAYLRNFQRVAVLAPNDAYGQKVRDELSSAYTQKGGIASPTELYAPSAANIEAAVTRMMAAYNNMSDDRKFQAIFVADGGYNLKNIMAALRKNAVDLKKIKLLGSGLWDDPAIAQIPELQGAWFPGSPPEPYRVFERRFVSLYGYKPIRLASLAYDATALLIQQSIRSPNGKIDPVMLTSDEGFMGTANGMFRLRTDGSSERKLAVLEITQEGIKMTEPASKSFLGGSK